ncbi:MAG: signal peptidase I [Verrucomicrobia bacterium]|nr:signal peptidase I [Verrucomicrobiota bacterium]
MLEQFFFNRRRRMERDHWWDVIRHCRKRLRQDRDVLSSKQEQTFRREIQKAQNALSADSPDMTKAGEALIEAYNRCFPSLDAPSWRENGEVILVALVVAMAVRAFFLQPFKIPTGSMQPTLNGITVRATQPHETTWWYRMISRPIFGEIVIHFVAETDGALDLSSLQARKFAPLHYGGRNGFFTWFPMDATQFRVGRTAYTFPTEPNKFRGDVLGMGFSSHPPLLKHGQVFRAGETILSCVVQTGDQLFVDRFMYNYRKPERGDIFVFETHDLPVSSPGDFYIKRLAGLPGDTLEIKELDLYLNGQKLMEPIGFRRVMSRRNGYRGYSSHSPGQQHLTNPEESYTLQERQYFALGDNSFASADSRMWGTVPYKNIVGRGFFVYWPFTRHFGRID